MDIASIDRIILLRKIFCPYWQRGGTSYRPLDPPNSPIGLPKATLLGANKTLTRFVNFGERIGHFPLVTSSLTYDTQSNFIVEKTYQEQRSKRQKRNKDLKVKLSEIEYANAKQKAQNAGYPLATYARNAILEQRIFDKKQRQINAKYLSQFAWIGNNLNQIARVLNTKNAQGGNDKINLVETNILLSEIQNELTILAKIITDNLENDEQ